eukprot:m.896168 g.896168  ORF g.896168 m.896168 type:complete len:268 (+) comp60006_c0_seq2:8529-9332(+)
MTSEDQAVYTSLEFDRVPARWSERSYPSCRPLGSWLTDFNHRLSFLSDWLKTGTPSSVWLSGFFYSKGFLTTLLQLHARSRNVALDSLELHITVCDGLPIPKEPWKDPAVISSLSGTLPSTARLRELGAVIDGLYLTGARWDATTHSLVDLQSNDLCVEMPPLLFQPAPLAADMRAQLSSNAHFARLFSKLQATPAYVPGQPALVFESIEPAEKFSCPLFRTTARSAQAATNRVSENHVASIPLARTHTDAYWALKGVALFCDPYDS